MMATSVTGNSTRLLNKNAPAAHAAIIPSLATNSTEALAATWSMSNNLPTHATSPTMTRPTARLAAKGSRLDSPDTANPAASRHHTKANKAHHEIDIAA